MAGLIQTGIQYRSRALEGFVRQSAQQQQIEQANEEMKAQQSAQKSAITGSLVGTGAMIGTYVYPGIGTVIGAAAGFLLSRLF